MEGAQDEQLLRSIAANIRRNRTRLKLTQEQLAEMAGVDIRFVQKLESGKVNPSATTLALFSTTLGITVSALFKPAELEEPQVGRPPRKTSRRTKE